MDNKGFVSTILAAAGNSTRMHGKGSKQFCMLGGKTVISHTLGAFLSSPEIGEIIISARREDFDMLREEIHLLPAAPIKNIRLAEGGASRQESVRKALKAVSEQAEYIAIHDGARPLVSRSVIVSAIQAAGVHSAAAVGVPVKDTIKRIAEDGEILSTPKRSELWAVQTPQVFRLTLYRKAMEYAMECGRDFTDDCQLFEFMGIPVYMVKGEYSNIKITTPEDILIAEGLLKWRDSHAVAYRPRI